MKPKSANTFSEFIQVTEDLGSNTDFVLYRGQSVQGNLVPRVARKNRSLNTTDMELKMLKELRRMGASLCDMNSFSDWDLLVVAQHFGMATRLLDWTSNPLAALWFACADPQDGPAYVYSLNADTLLTGKPNEKGPFELTKTRVFKPKLNNQRIIAQDGWFTAHRFSKKASKFVTLESNRHIKKHLCEIEIKSARRYEMLKSLDRHGVNGRTLFPDLEGLCRYLSWKHIPA